MTDEKTTSTQYGGNCLDVARSEYPAVFVVYHVCLLAKAVFGSGFVLGSVDVTGAAYRDMPVSQSVRRPPARGLGQHWPHTRAGGSIFGALDARRGGGTAAAVHGLLREETQHLAGVADTNWLAQYNRNCLAERNRVSQANGL